MHVDDLKVETQEKIFYTSMRELFQTLTSTKNIINDNATHMIEAFNFGIPGFASSVVKDNEEDLSSLTVMLKTVSQKRLCSQFTVGDKRCV